MEELAIGDYVRIKKDVYYNIWKIVKVETDLVHVTPVKALELRANLTCSFPRIAVVFIAKTVAGLYKHQDYSMSPSW